MKKPGIFVLESDWSSDLRERLSVQPLMQVLEHCEKIETIHCKVHDTNHLCKMTLQWTQKKHKPYSIGYFAMHGVREKLRIGRKKIHLLELAETLRGRCVGKTFYFGSCSTLNADEKVIEEFRYITKAKCVAGYTNDVDWIESASFELLLFSCLINYQRSDAVHNWLKKYQQPFVDKLGFEMHYGRGKKPRS